jgi:hypothetical protein
MTKLVTFKIRFIPFEEVKIREQLKNKEDDEEL